MDDTVYDAQRELASLVRKITPWERCVRACRYWWQRRTRGWDDSELWNLDMTIGQFVAPRIVRFAELQKARELRGVPGDLTEAAWDKRLASMAEAFRMMGEMAQNAEARHKIEYGVGLFAEHWESLWD